MRITRAVLLGCVILLAASLLVWAVWSPWTMDASPAGENAPPPHRETVIHIGIIPERDIFEQRQRYQFLAQYLSEQLERRVEIRTAVSYAAMIDDLRSGEVDAAFLGSLATAIAVDRIGAVPVVRPMRPDGRDRYCGVIIARADSDIDLVDDLAGRRVAMVRTTFAGHLFPVAAFLEHGLWGGDRAVVPVWVGTHDEVLRELMAGRVDAGALKNLRLDALEQQLAGTKVRRVLSSDHVPENSLVIPGESAPIIARELPQVLLGMADAAEGRALLERFGAARFVPCRIEEYDALYDVVERIGPDWPSTQIDGPPPARRTTAREEK